MNNCIAKNQGQKQGKLEMLAEKVECLGRIRIGAEKFYCDHIRRECPYYSRDVIRVDGMKFHLCDYFGIFNELYPKGKK